MATQVFTINDIDLLIAPESISVQKEDLVYNWKTLRTKASTKIPSGHGQMLVQIRIPFMDRQILALHRLIIEFRQSPFCFIENVWLRSALCPEWSLGQKMAFTMTGIDVVPYPGTANAWIVNMELTWFNYFPYVHNWLYRRDWVTDWQSSKNDTGEPYWFKSTIGWDIDGDGNRKGNRLNIIEEKYKLNGDETVHQEWTALNDSYQNKVLTIEDMEILHRGEVFDMMPLPGMMDRAFFVQQPGQSLIYKRYINFLQRDALLKNFNIDIETIVQPDKTVRTDLGGLLFSKLVGPETIREGETAATDGNANDSSDYVQAIHDVKIPDGLQHFFPNLQSEWDNVFSTITTKILGYKQGVEFSFATYKSVQLPNKIAMATQAIMKKAKQDVQPFVEDPEEPATESFIYGDDYKIRVRRGLSEPKGFHLPLGKNSGELRTFAEFNKGTHGFQSWRSAKTLEDIYTRKFSEGRFHWGMDISDMIVEDETPVYAAKDGKCVYAKDSTGEHVGDENFWRAIDWDGGGWTRIESVNDNGPVELDWEWACKNHLGGKYNSASVGTIISSLRIPGRYYYVDFNDAGQNIMLEHNDGKERSKYLHLSRVLVQSGHPVTAGQIVGYVGHTSRIDEAAVQTTILMKVDKPEGTFGTPIHINDVGRAKSEVSDHLHFEYYERLDWDPKKKNVPEPDSTPLREPPYDRGYVPVDIRPTCKWAESQGYDSKVDGEPVETDATIETVKKLVDADSGLTKNEKTDLLGAMDMLYKQGYFYYDRQEDVVNVWWRPWRVSLQSVNPETAGYDQVITTDTAVLTNMTAGLRHIVANIPILGHEFPTQQHLGSIEPYYNLEFHLLDDSNTLEGIGERGGILTAMRYIMQHNSRKFRLIPDSWCLLTDCFLTRLLGTLQESDRLVAPMPDDKEAIGDFILNRRTIISRAQIETIEGNPGLSRLQMELQETNPYTTEAIEITAPTLTSVEKSRELILNKIYHAQWADKYKDLALKLLIAKIAGANTSAPGDDFGQLTLNKLDYNMTDSVGYITSDIFSGGASEVDQDPGGEGARATKQMGHKNEYRDAYTKLQNSGSLGADGKAYVVKDDYNTIAVALRAQGIPVETINKVGVGTWAVIPEKAVGLQKNLEQSHTDAGKTEVTIYSLKKELSATQESLLMGEVPITKIQQLMIALRAITLSAEMYLSEEANLLTSDTAKRLHGTPLPKSKIREELYNLEIEPSLFRTFEYYLEQVAISSYYPNLARLGIGPTTSILDPENKTTVVQALENNPGWLKWQSEKDFNDGIHKLDTSGVGFGEAIGTAFNASMYLSVGGAVVGSAVSHTVSSLHNLSRLAASAGNEEDIPAEQLHSYWADYYNEATKNIAEAITRLYVNQLPLVSLAASEWVKDIMEDSMFGALATNLVGDSGLPAIANTRTRLTNAVRTSGHFGPHPWAEKLPFFMQSTFEMATVVEDLVLDSEGNPVDPNVTSPTSLSIKTKPVPYWQSIAENYPGWGTLLVNVMVSEATFLDQSGVPAPGSAFDWRVEQAVETEKVAYFKQQLAALADQALGDPLVLRAYGLEGLSIDRNQISKGKPAYPDLDLPYHPYYGDLYSVSPDFYMWNMYDDGDAFNDSVRAEITAGINGVLQNCYNSLNKQQKGKKYTPKNDKAIQDTAFDSPLNVKYAAEGTDGSSGNEFAAGPTGSPFYPTDESNEAIATFLEDNKDKAAKSIEEAGKMGTEDRIEIINNMDRQASIVNSKKLRNQVKPGLRLATGEGPFGAGAGVQYPARLSDKQYIDLKNQVDGIIDMFGSKSGYLKTKEIPDEIADRLSGTPLAQDKQPSHKYDMEALKQLAEHSSHDIFGQKRRMARAFPTFKLYFIEEDEFESRLLNFDDFYSYNAVKDFSVTMNRKSPADVAVITLQNVSGVLDGTKRDAVADLDYFTKAPQKAARAGDNVLKGTDGDQPFGSLVLRPGMNVQLRAGFSNDPDNLTVMINGRVVDVQWNQQGDNAQIMVQSFGSELLQVLKGTNPEQEEVYYTTHQLLGALAMEPELVHFGRWEIGQLFQVGEAKDSVFDFYDYAKEANFGVFEHSAGAVKWLFSHPVILGVLALGGVALASRLPGTSRLFAPASRFGARFSFINNLLAKGGIVGKEGTVAFEKTLLDTMSRTTMSGAAMTTERGIVGNQVVRQALESRVEALIARSVVIGTREGGAAFGTTLEKTLRARALALLGNEVGFLDDGVRFVGGRGPSYGMGARTVKSVAAEMAAFESYANSMLFKGRYMTNPFSTAKGVDIIGDIGRKPFTQVLGQIFNNPLRNPGTGLSGAILGAAAVGAAGDAGSFILDKTGIYDATIGRANRYFAAAKVRIMLSPQDDNLYPPSPKDYMTLGQGVWPQLKNYVSYTAISALTGSDEAATMVGHYFRDTNAFDKRAPIECYQYKLNNTYIWDVLDEMCLRHPGWIYAVRPYGKKFRYTLFFGVPSQRYWSQPADNSFILRANKLANMLTKDISSTEYKSLYGDSIDGMSIEDYDKQLAEQADKEIPSSAEFAARGNLTETYETYHGQEIVRESDGSIRIKSTNELVWSVSLRRRGTSFNEVDPRSEIETAQRVTQSAADLEGAAYTDKLAALRNQSYSAKALAEYLKALNLRFIPLRRYHSISSEIDLVYNGIIGSENSTFNAVDIAYFNEDPEKDIGGPVGSSLVKVHAFMPENMLRVKSIEPYSNCRGYQMSMRYGMGALAFAMRDMYRGEIITLGNPRIMPWDIIVLMDTYNSMVGPIEVEQVVHNFSNETGFITEIKPSAVVICNETSSWPILEAMKLASLAVRNVEEDSLGITASSFGSLGTAVNWLTDHGPGGNNPDYANYAKMKMKEIYGDGWDDIHGLKASLSDVIFNGQPTDDGPQKDFRPSAIGVEEVEGMVEQVSDSAQVAAAGLGLLGIATGIGLGFWASRGGMALSAEAATMAKWFDGAVATTAIAGGAALLTADKIFSPPSLMSLLGGSLLMLQCLKGDSLMVVPLMKNGYPIAAGLNYHDPSMIWRNFLGDLGRYADDVLGGGRDLADLWGVYGMYAWRRLPTDTNPQLDADKQLMTNDLSGE